MAGVVLVVLTLISRTLSAPDAAPESKATPVPTPNATPISNPTPKATASPDAKPSIYSHPEAFSVAPFPPFIHPAIYRSLIHLPQTNSHLPYPRSVLTHEIPVNPLSHELSYAFGLPPQTFGTLGNIGPRSPPISFETLDHTSPVGPSVPRVAGLRKQQKYCVLPNGYVPPCASNSTSSRCVLDAEYPANKIAEDIHKHRSMVLTMYAEVADLSTQNSVVRPLALHDETYICPTEVSYVRLRRAVNTKGEWRIIVNNVKLGNDVFTQTARLEECSKYNLPCPLVPSCYNSKCVQKNAYQRFLVFDPCQSHFPFVIETFKLPSACACFIDKLYISFK